MESLLRVAVEGVQLVSIAHEFKFQAPDGKQRATDALDACHQGLVARRDDRPY